MTLGTSDEPSNTGCRYVQDGFERLASIRRAAGPFNGPTGVTVLDSGEVFVADGYGNTRVHKFSPGGTLIKSWGSPGPNPGQFRLPHAIHHDQENRIWVVDRENSRIQIFDEDGEFITEWTDLIRPTDLAIHEDMVFVTELCKRLSVYGTGGNLLARWGNDQDCKRDNLFIAPHTVEVDSEGSLYIGGVPFTYENINRGTRTIQKFKRVSNQ
jgi:DNA-binding beta-propeller fold protein YncE